MKYENDQGFFKRLCKPSGWGALLSVLALALSLYLLFLVVRVRDAGTWSDGAYDLFRYCVIAMLGLSGIAAQIKVTSYIAHSPRRGGGFVLLALGVAFLAARIAGGTRGPGALLGVLGFVMLAASAWLLGSEVLAAGKKRRVARNGQRHEARILRVVQEPVRLNGKQKYRVECEWDGRQYQASGYLPLHGAEGGTVPLWIDPENPDSYYLDLENIHFLNIS